MKRQEMLDKLQEQVTAGKFRTMQKWSDERLGKGYTVKSHNSESTRYCFITYYVM